MACLFSSITWPANAILPEVKPVLPLIVKSRGCTLSGCRPTMILYGIDNIRDLFGHKVSAWNGLQTQQQWAGHNPRNTSSSAGPAAAG